MDKISIDNANEPIETEETLPEIIEEQVSEDVILEQNSEEIDDLTSHKVAHDIKNKIEEQLQYPGTIKVTVIRETRAVEEAK